MKKNKILIITLILGILFLTSYLYSSYATSTGVTLGNDENTYDILLNDSTDTVTVSAKSSKTIYYQFSNTNKGTIKYHIGYISNNVIAKVWWDTEDKISGTIEYGEYKFIKLKLINDSTSDDTITIKPVLGYVNGGDVIPDSNTTLVTGTINEVNTMSIKPETALTTLGIAKTAVEEISFVKDNIVPVDALGSTTVSSDNSVMLWYTASETEDMYKVYIGSDNGITSFPADSSQMFKGYNEMTSINLNNIDTSLVTAMTNLFSGCSKLSSIDLSNFDTQRVVAMTAMFYNCNNILNLDLSSFITSKLKYTDSMFSNCRRLENINFGYFDTSNVTYLDSMFFHCEKLKTIDLSNFDTSKVTSFRKMFEGCFNVKYLDLSSFNTTRVKNFEHMFFDCNNLVYINLKSFDTSNATNMSKMFYYCNSLVSIDLSNFNTSKVEKIERMLAHCINLKTIIFSDDFSLNALIEDKSSSNEKDYAGVYYMFNDDSNLNNDTLNDILKVLSTVGSGIQTKTLIDVGFTSAQSSIATTLSNYQMFTNAGWTTGY